MATTFAADTPLAVTELVARPLINLFFMGQYLIASVDLPVTGCDDPHTHEIYAVLESAADPYPGFDALEDEAQVACLSAFEPYVGISPFDSR